MIPLKAATACVFVRPARRRMPSANSPMRTAPSPGFGWLKSGATAHGCYEQAAVSAREAAEVLGPVVGGRLGLEAAEHAVEQRVDELLLCGEVVVERHRHGA